jgi:hypothetical protein
MRERSQPNMSALFEKHMAVTNRVFRKCANKKKQILYFLFGHLFFRQPQTCRFQNIDSIWHRILSQMKASDVEYRISFIDAIVFLNERMKQYY